MTESHIFQPNSWSYSFHHQINNNNNFDLINVDDDNVRDDQDGFCYPLGIPTLLMEAEESYEDHLADEATNLLVEEIKCSSSNFPVDVVHHHLDVDNMDIITTEDVLLYFKDQDPMMISRSSTNNAQFQISIEGGNYYYYYNNNNNNSSSSCTTTTATTNDQISSSCNQTMSAVSNSNNCMGRSLRDASVLLDVTSQISQQQLVMTMPLPAEEYLGGVYDHDQMQLLVDNDELAVFHLLTAYAEAMEMGQEDLAGVISKRITDKVSPVGDTVERLLYYMFRGRGAPGGLQQDKQQYCSSGDHYLNQESAKNFYQAFKAFYQVFPYGKFAHFAANLAILQSLPQDADTTVRIFDFDMGEGIQWASLFEALGRRGRQHRQVTLTVVKFLEQEEDQDDQLEDANNSLIMWRFEDTKKRLLDYAKSCGLKLKVEEMGLADVAGELQTILMRQQQQQQEVGRLRDHDEFMVFNCMVGLPHMGRVRSRRDVFQFLHASQNFLRNTYTGTGAGGGVMTFGDGDAWEKVRINAATYGSFLDGNMAHYQALLESIQVNFPTHLGEARTAMECLFVAPSVSCLAWAEKWEEMKKLLCGHHYHEVQEIGFGLQGLKVSRESLMEAKEVVREGESLYGVRVQLAAGETHNDQMVMDWRGIPMVRVSCWTST